MSIMRRAFTLIIIQTSIRLPTILTLQTAFFTVGTSQRMKIRAALFRACCGKVKRIRKSNNARRSMAVQIGMTIPTPAIITTPVTLVMVTVRLSNNRQKALPSIVPARLPCLAMDSIQQAQTNSCEHPGQIPVTPILLDATPARRDSVI